MHHRKLNLEHVCSWKLCKFLGDLNQGIVQFHGKKSHQISNNNFLKFARAPRLLQLLTQIFFSILAISSQNRDPDF